MAKFLDTGLDEMAAGAYVSFWNRLGAIFGVGLVCLAFLPWPDCAIWVAFTAGLDTISWRVTKPQYLGLPITVAHRLKHVGVLVGGVASWVLLGVVLWRTDTAAGALCAVVIWLSVMGFAQVHAYQSRAGYLLSGVIPAAGMLITTLVAPNPSLPHGFAVWAMLFLSVAFAVSSARQTMDARRRYEQATQNLRESEASYRLLADNITDVVSLATADNQRLYVSPSIERILRFSPGELMITPNYTYMHPDDVTALQEFLGSVTIENSPRTTEYRVFARDGSIVWAETTFSRLNDGSGRLLGVSRDISHRKTLEIELIDAVTRAEAAAAAKTDFLANMTHELRTPLTAILGFSGVLRQSKALSDQDARHVGLIHDASQTLLGVIGDVLDYSKLEAGGLELDPQSFDPAAMADSALAIVADQAAIKDLTLSAQIGDGIPALVGDAPRLRQVLLNFLSNAIKFTRAGAVELALSHHVEAELCRLRVEVRDSGIGIPEKQLGSVFMRFTQADASVSRQFGGTGLGLAISKQLIETMGGRIGASSVVGQGSTFWFEVDLPLAIERQAVQAPDQAHAPLDRSMRVLVVEDNAVNRELVTTLLSPFDIEIDTVADGAEAVEAVGLQHYDVILMDMQMPVMDGLTATRRIRALDTGASRVPIVAMTANILPEHIARCREAGMDDHLGKPINPARLLEALERWTAPDARCEALEAAS